ncbi:MAG TPA: RHS repeat domain-containing protein [Bacillota bacterium]|nr:RHS repeat domain-containing protein [Bacillota bacterium]
MNVDQAIGIDIQDLKPLPTPVITTPPSSNAINKTDVELNGLSKKLWKLKESAEGSGNISLAKQIEQKYNDLIIQNGELHKLSIFSVQSETQNVNQEQNTVSSSVYRESNQIDSVVKEVYEPKEIAKAEELNLQKFFETDPSGFDKLKNIYTQEIEEFGKQLNVDTTSLLAEQQEMSSQAIIDLQVGTPIDVDLPAGSSQIYRLTPSQVGSYKIYTGPYGGTGGSNDTILELYSDANLTNKIASNDDANGTVFSEIRKDLSAGVSYYVKLYAYGGGAVHARLAAVLEPIVPITVNLNVPVDMDIPSGGYKVFKFTASNPDYFQFYTTYYGGTSSSGSSDTVIYIYSDQNLSKLIGYNDDYNGAFSLLKREMNSNQTYYIKVAGYGGGSVHARFIVNQAARTISDLQMNTPLDIQIQAYEFGYYKFTPSTADNYHFYTGTYGGTGNASDTILYLYSDANFSNLLTYNDDANSTSYSDVKWQLKAGTPYYLKLGGYAGASVQARLAVGLLNSSYEYQYDANNRLVTVLSSGVAVLQLTYDANGNLLSKRRP